jgi:hypothetical protein
MDVIAGRFALVDLVTTGGSGAVRRTHDLRLDQSARPRPANPRLRGPGVLRVREGRPARPPVRADPAVPRRGGRPRRRRLTRGRRRHRGRASAYPPRPPPRICSSSSAMPWSTCTPRAGCTATSPWPNLCSSPPGARAHRRGVAGAVAGRRRARRAPRQARLTAVEQCPARPAISPQRCSTAPAPLPPATSTLPRRWVCDCAAPTAGELPWWRGARGRGRGPSQTSSHPRRADQ